MIRINKLEEVGKFVAFVRANAKATFEVAKEVLPELFRRIEELAKSERIKFDLITPDMERIITFCRNGAIAGAGLGFLVAGWPGSAVGAVIGVGLGYTAAHFTVIVIMGENEDTTVLVLE